MPDLLGPTNPVPGFDPSAGVKIAPPSINDPLVQNIVDPTRVVRPDGRTEQQDAGDATASHAARYESNFMTFLQRLRNAPELTTALLRMMQGPSLQVSSGIRDGFAAEMAQFLDFLKMDGEQLKGFLQNQMESGTRFSGPLFDALRNAYTYSHSEVLQTDVLQFLRKFSDYSSTPHLERKMLHTLSDMSRSLPSQWGDQLMSLAGKLQNAMASKDRAGGLKIIREQIIPLVARYVSLTHDHGRARNLLSMLTLDVVRYENGDEEGLLQALRHLSVEKALPKELAKMPDRDLLLLLKGSDFFKTSRENTFAEKLANVTNRALKGEGGMERQEAFRNILSSLLINESVYMPLNHIMLPLNWNGHFMFSEMWVDPDANRDSSNRSGGEDGERGIRMLIKMDVESLGAFDVLLYTQGNNVSLQIACPAQVAVFADQVSDALSEILERNGLQSDSVRVTAMKRPVTVSEVFPKILERMGGVNVKI